MTEKLKFIVTYSKTINIGNFESEKFGLSEEYTKGEGVSIEEGFVNVKKEVEKQMYGVAVE